MAKPKERCSLSDCEWHDSVLSFGHEHKSYYLTEHCATCINLYRDYDNYEQKEDENGKTKTS